MTPSLPGSPERGWSPGRVVAAVGLGLLAVAATWSAWADVLHIALRDEEASQVWLVLPVFVWLLLVRLDRLKQATPGPWMAGPTLVAFGAGVSLYGYLNLTQAMWHGGALLAVVGAVLSVAGPRVFRAALPALPVLLFLVPVPGMIRQRIAIPMQTQTASVGEVAFELLGMTVTRSGNVLNYLGQDVAVAEACNGMRMVFALLLVTYAFAFATPLRPGVRVLLLVLSPLAAIGCNVLRLVPTVYLYGHYPETWGPTFHDFSGWAMLALAFGLLLGTVRLLNWAEVPVMAPPRVTVHRHADPAV